MTRTLSPAAAACPVSGVTAPDGCPVSPQAAEFDPFDDAYQQDPPDYVRWARDQEPTFWSPQLGYWVVTRYDTIKAIFRDNLTFSPSIALEKITPTGTRRTRCSSLRLRHEPHAGQRGRAGAHAAPPRADGAVHARGTEAPRAAGARADARVRRPLHRRRPRRPGRPDAVGGAAHGGVALPRGARGRHGDPAQVLDRAHREHLGPAQARGAGGGGARGRQLLAVRRPGARQDAAGAVGPRLDAVRHPQAERPPRGGDRLVPALDDDGRHRGRPRDHRQRRRQRDEAAAAAPARCGARSATTRA